MIFTEVKRWLASKCLDFYKNGKKGLVHRCVKCAVIGAQYVEKKESVD